jgi:gliding motility associated protien GldN
MHIKKLVLIVVSTLFVISGLLAQEAEESRYNEWSTNPIRLDDQMFKKALWFRLDLRQKMNVGFFSDNNELTRVLIEAVKSGQIRPFKSDSLATRMTYAEFLENLRLPTSGGDETAVAEGFDDNDDVWAEDTPKPKAAAPAEYLPRQLYLVEIKEDLIFDKRRSRMYHDVLAITIVIPAEQTPTGIEKVVASFSYKELVETVFANNPKAIWYNPQNSAQHHSITDAITLRLFDGILVKYENPKNNMLVDMYNGGKMALAMSQQVLYQLMEYEATLWEE